MEVTANASQHGPRAAVILSRRLRPSDLKNYEPIAGWEFVLLSDPYRAAAEVLAADEAVLAYDGSAPAPTELLALAMERAAAVTPAVGANPIEAARRAILARTASQDPADDAPATDAPRASADDDRSAAAAQQQTPTPAERPAPADRRSAPPAKPVRRPPRSPNKGASIPGMPETPDPGELLSAEELRALLGNAGDARLQND